jgi:hypothetical protein
LRQATSADATRSWLWVDVGPTSTPSELLADLTVQFDCEAAAGDSIAQRTQRVRDRLEESALEDRAWGLIVDEAHLAGPELLEQIRVLANASVLGRWLRPIVLCGQTALLRRLRGPSLSSLDTRIESRIHLKPLDADEAIEWLTALGSTLPTERAEAWHRDALGNPARLRRLWAQHTTLAPIALLRPAPELPSRSEPTAPSPGSASLPPLGDSPLVPSTPPLQIDEGVIEVGWAEGDSSARGVDLSSAKPLAVFEDAVRTQPDLTGLGDARSVERISDRYAALQAWNEWSAGAGDQAGNGLSTSPSDPGSNSLETSSSDDDQADGPLGRPGVWAEPADQFAPYGDLFRPRNPAPQADA